MRTNDLPSEWAEAATRCGIRPTMRGLAEAADVAPSTISRLVLDRRSSPDTIERVRRALRLTSEAMFRLAKLPTAAAGPYVPPAEAHQLSPKQRTAIDAVIRSMVDPGQELPNAAPITDAGGTPAHVTDLPRAARRSPGDKERRAREARRRGEESQEDA